MVKTRLRVAEFSLQEPKRMKEATFFRDVKILKIVIGALKGRF